MCMRKSVNIILSKNIRAMRWYHDGVECVLGSKSLENELFWTIVNVLVVSPVIQRFNNCMCYNFNISVRTNYQINICTSSNECSTFIQETPVTHLQQSKIKPLASQPIYSYIQIQAMARGVKIFDAHARKCATPTMIIPYPPENKPPPPFQQ